MSQAQAGTAAAAAAGADNALDWTTGGRGTAAATTTRS